MHTDARTLESNTVIEGDVCIVGAGAAGLSMALDWIGTGHRVILLEGGGFDYEAAQQARYRGENIGQRYFPLETSRLHYFGGTTGHWAGFCSDMDPIDFQVRDWVPHSGWPFDRATLDPFYARAQPLLQLGPYRYDLDYWEGQDPALVRLPLDETRVHTKIWQHSPPTRFGTEYRDAVTGADTLHLFTHANVVDIEANEGASHIERLHVRTLEGKAHTVQARHYVLACGALQNARLLLASTQQMPQGLGNAHDVVGRYFMEHLEIASGALVIAPGTPMQLYRFTGFQIKARGELAIPEAQQRAHKILNCTLSLWPGVSDDIRDRIATFDSAWFRNRPRRENRPEPEPESGPPAEVQQYTLNARLEQAPNARSRVVLSTERDATGVPRANLDWQLLPLDKQSIRTTCRLVAEEMGRSGLGRVQMLPWLQDEDDTLWPRYLAAGWHHMGTTRMHPDPKQGVVDANCKVHGIDNLYTAGSSAFPTAGTVNPTLTLVALSLRLSDHIKSKMG